MSRFDYIMFPLPLLREVFRKPKTGFRDILSVGIYRTAHTLSVTESDALTQLVYCYYNGGLTDSLQEELDLLSQNRVLLLVAALGLLFGCQKTPAELNITARSMTFNQTGAPITGEGTIEISSNAAWTITAADSWVHVDKESGTGNQTVAVTLDHGTTDPRNSTITIQAEGLTKMVPISQIFDVYAEMDDEGFREYCRNAKNDDVVPFDRNGDGILSPEEAAAVKWIELSQTGISSLKGIECFTGIEILYCDNNAITSLDLSHNTKLVYLHCYNNQLETLNITGCTLLYDVECGNNKLTSLDVSTNTALRYLICNENEIANLDASKCTLLEHLHFGKVGFHQVTSMLDISTCRKLEILTIENQTTDVYVWPDFDITTPSNSISQIKYLGGGSTKWIKR